mgnify:CR=1 FL=1
MDKMFAKNIRKQDIQLHKTNVKAKTWRESGFAYQIKEEGTEDENCCSKERTRTARTQREKMKKWQKWRDLASGIVFVSKPKIWAGLFKIHEVRKTARQPSSAYQNLPRVIGRGSVTVAVIEETFWPNRVKPDVKLARLEKLKGF